jgi:hypothetical protein
LEIPRQYHTDSPPSRTIRVSESQAMFTFKNFQDLSSHQIFGHMYEALNVDEKKLITQFGRKPRNESFESN